MSDIAAIVLAAGTGSRYRAADPAVASKLIVEIAGKPMVRNVVEAALASSAAPVIVVTGHAREAVETALAGLAVKSVFNPTYATGLASSLQAGLAAVPPNAIGAIVLLGDMPAVTGELVDRLAARFREAPFASAVVPVVGGRRGNPVVLSRALFPALKALCGDEGARRLLHEDPNVIEIPVEDEGAGLDVDTPEGFEAARAAPLQGDRLPSPDREDHRFG